MGRVVWVAPLSNWKTPKSNVVRIRVVLVPSISVVSLVSYVYPPAVQNGRRRA